MALTFFAWGDTHFGYQQRFVTEDFRADIIEQMNRLPGWPYPEEMGGCVAEPAFVMHGGDWIDGSHAGCHELDIYRTFVSRLRFPHYETQGNHDLGDAAATYMEKKYGGSCHVFETAGAVCISLSGGFDEREKGTVTSDALAFLRKTLAAVRKDVPVILFTHSPLRAQVNGEAVVEALAGRRVALAIAAHKHSPDFYDWQGVHCIDLGHCRNHPIDPEYGRSFTVVHMTANTIDALPWRWDCREWDCQQRWRNQPIPEAEQRFRMHAEF